MSVGKKPLMKAASSSNMLIKSVDKKFFTKVVKKKSLSSPKFTVFV
jgi:hypothetical protein